LFLRLNFRKQLLAQQTYINTFFQKFALSEDEEIILSNAINDGVISDAFFKVLRKLCAIETNVKEALEADPENIAM
jgi:hypothetical protein